MTSAHSQMKKAAPRTAGAGEDPVIRRIREWDEATRAFAAKRDEIRGRWERVPRRVREWKGVDLGHGIGFEGEAIRLRARDPELLDEVFGKRLADARTEGQTVRIAAQRARAQRELDAMERAGRIAFEAADLPFGRDDEDAFWEPYLDRIDAAAVAVAETRATSLEGLFAKLAFAARLTREALAENPEGEPAGFTFVHRLVLSAAADAERLKAD